LQNSSSSLLQVLQPIDVTIEILPDPPQILQTNQFSSATNPIEMNKQTEHFRTQSEEPHSNEKSENSKENEDDGDDEDADDDNDEEEESSKKKRLKSHPKDPRFNYGAWSQEEEERFLKALELFGRSWKQVNHELYTHIDIKIHTNTYLHTITLSHTVKLSNIFCLFLFVLSFWCMRF
jgi:cobalamin biosynthesis protein CobT